MPSVGTCPGVALPGGAPVSVPKDMSTYTIALDTTTISGGPNSIGCPRTAAAPLRVVVRTRSAPIATAVARAGSAGPWPMRALLRTRSSAARRWVGVSPGSR